jgi:hypothetical protein
MLNVLNLEEAEEASSQANSTDPRKSTSNDIGVATGIKHRMLVATVAATAR